MSNAPAHSPAAADEPTPAAESGATLDDCWNRIGVQGDRSCPSLEQFIHCRNCPVYHAAAATLLGALQPDGYIAERSAQFARERPDHAHETVSMMLFRLGAELLAVPLGALAEVADLRPLHRLPHHDGLVLGLVNVRGELLICLSLARLLGVGEDAAVPPAPAGAASADPGQACYRRLLVLAGEGGRLVVPVDEVHGVHRCHPNELQPVPRSIAGASATYTSAMLPWRGQVVACLDQHLLMYALNRSLA